MWELGNLWTDVRNTPMASYHTMMHEIHVLLVDHDSEGLLNTAKLLEICQYRVMSSDDNTHMAMRALENGAFLYIKKPATMEMMRCLWQHVLREKTRIIRERDMLVAANNHGARGIEFRDVINHHREDQNPSNLESMIMMKNKGKSKKKVRGRNEDDDEEYDSENHRYTINNSSNVKRKMCTEWTHELHAKFMNAVEQLGEGRCFPKEILELMNVPGLTRMQVASHLQKCRNDNWRSPLERKSHQAAQHTSSDPSGPGYKPRRFGSKPQLGKPRSGQAHESNGTGEESETHSETEMPTNGNMGTGPTMTNTSHSHHHQQHFGPMVQPGPSNGPPGANSSTNPRHSADEFFNFPDVDCLIQNLSGLPQGSGLNHPNPGPAAYHFDPNYHEQNSGGPSMDTKSNWSSETSNFESDHSETRGHD
ncbi:hypothetical protein DH2020_013204 [Rehmannia glutinosa]|uniref:HTH myb-type domain-containing protein n=1 Tax=Rehmannia glutinosa TaxID=99300 RepID=A0ABR0X575_REHGL